MRKLFVTLLAALALVAVMLTPGLVGTAQAATSAPAGASTAAGVLSPTHQAKRTAKHRHKKGWHKHRHTHKHTGTTHSHRHGPQHPGHHHPRRNKNTSNRSAKPIPQVRTWNRLAHCESTSRWFVNTGNGYYGGLQISPSTWRGYGGQRFAALPHRASKPEQIIVGKRIRHGQGWGAWPTCSRKVGLR